MKNNQENLKELNQLEKEAFNWIQNGNFYINLVQHIQLF